jgi:predicted HicB family RNase H-like nuclease
MSKNVLKNAQRRRKERDPDEENSQSSEAMREALLESEAHDERATKRLNAEIPSGLHERFKEACKSEGISMTRALTQLVETYVELKE